MSNEDPLDRRTVLKLTGSTAAMAAIAGCGGPSDEDAQEEDEPVGNGDGNETDGVGDGNETEDNETEDNETEDNETEDNETEDNETGDNETEDNETEDNESEDNESAGGDGEWADVSEIVLEGYTENWVGVEPAPIEGEENPTLVLTEGQEYDVTWENMDGEPHDFVLWDQDGEELESSDQTDEEGEQLTLTFEATSEMVEYVCTIHPGTMIGDVEVESE